VRLDDLSLGMTVSWIHVPRGGYGFPVPVDAIVERIYKRRVRIAVQLRDGLSVVRVVDPESLRPRSA
jgi:hypothetical protein